MSSWIQNPEPPYQLIPRREYVRPKELSHFIHGDIESFVSPVDKSVITDRKQLRHHNDKNNVVPAGEFTPEFYEQKAKERERFYNGQRSRAEVQASKQEIYETMMNAERR